MEPRAKRSSPAGQAGTDAVTLSVLLLLFKHHVRQTVYRVLLLRKVGMGLQRGHGWALTWPTSSWIATCFSRHRLPAVRS